MSSGKLVTAEERGTRHGGGLHGSTVSAFRRPGKPPILVPPEMPIQFIPERTPHAACAPDRETKTSSSLMAPRTNEPIRAARYPSAQTNPLGVRGLERVRSGSTSSRRQVKEAYAIYLQ